MFENKRGNGEKFFAFVVFLSILVLPAAAWGASIPGDPDGDAVPTLDEQAGGTNPLQADTDMDGLLDGWEIYYTNTDPLRISTDGGTVDGLKDSDGGGIGDAQELVNGTDINDASDDGKLLGFRIAQPLPAKDAAGNWRPVAVRFNQPDQIGGILTFSSAPGAFSSYLLQFDGSAAFDSPVQYGFASNLGDRSAMVAAVRSLWTKVTAEGRVVYCRFIAQVSGATQMVASNILTFVINNGASTPALIWPAADGTSAMEPRVRPSVTWKTSTAYTGYRLVFTGSKQLGREVVIPGLNEAPFPNSRNFLYLGWNRLAPVSALGDVIYCKVYGTDAAGRRVFSNTASFSIKGGATALAASVKTTPMPDDIPVFTANAGTGAYWQILFSNSEDFNAPGYATPLATGAISWTPTAEVWKSLTSLGPELFWTVRGYVGDLNYSTFPQGFAKYPLDKFLSFTGLYPNVTPNKVGTELQSFTVNLASGPAADAYRIMVCGDKRCAGPRAGDPNDDYTADTTWPAAYSQAALPADFPTRIANLYADPVWLVAKGRTAPDTGAPTGGGAFFFSEPCMVKAATFLRLPSLDVPLNSRKVGEVYDVNWLKSADDTDAPNTVLHYQLQEATDLGFSQNLQSFDVDGTTRRFTKTGIKGAVRFFYRARAVNSFGRSSWSNVDSMLVEDEFTWHPEYITGPLPYNPPGLQRHPNFDLYGTTDNFAVDENNGYNAQYDTGVFSKSGSGWILVSLNHHLGHGFNMDSYYVSRSIPISGTEKARWAPKIKKSGTYEVWTTFYQSTNRPNHVEMFLKSDDAATEFGPFVIDQREVYGAYYTQTWVSLGRYRFTAGGSYYVDMRYNRAFNNPGNGTHSLCADAVLFQYIPDGQ